MSTEFTRTKAFAALSDILALPGTDSLRLVDLSIATPVIDLKQIIRSGIAELWSFSKIVQHAGADTSDVGADPWSVAVWSNISRGTGAGLTTALPNTHEALLLSIGVTGSVGSGTLDPCVVYLRQDNLSSAPRPRVVLFWTDGGVGTSTNQMQLNTSSGSEQRVKLPLLFGPTRSPWRLRFTVTSTAAADITLAIRLLAAPRGVLPLT